MRRAMRDADGWFICRTGFVEAFRAIDLVAGRATTSAFRDEWPAFAVVEVDQALVERAGSLAIDRDLRSLDSLHLAAALLLPPEDLVLATWDRRLHAAARAEQLRVLPSTLG